MRTGTGWKVAKSKDEKFLNDVDVGAVNGVGGCPSGGVDGCPNDGCQNGGMDGWKKGVTILNSFLFKC